MRLRRVPVDYTDPSPPHDLGSMPDPKKWGSMEISQRVKGVSIDIQTLWIALAASFLIAVGCSLLGFLMSPFIRPLDLFIWVLSFLAVWAAGAFVSVFFSGDISLENMFYRIVVPPAVLLSGLLLGEVLGRRSPTALVLGLVMIAFLGYAVHMILSFYRDWLTTDPTLRTNDREMLRRLTLHPNYGLICGFVLLAVVGPSLSIWASMIAAVVLVLFGLFYGRTDPDSFRIFLDKTSEMLGVSYNYPVDRPVAPGVWVPNHPQIIRRCALLGSVLVVTLFVAIAFYAFLPWDLPPLRSTLSETFTTKVHGNWITARSGEALEPHVGPFPEKYTPPVSAEEFTVQARNATPAEASKFRQLAQEVDRGYRENGEEIAAFGDRFLETFPLGWFLVSLAGFSEHPVAYGLAWFWCVLFTFAFVPAFLLATFRHPLERLLVYHPALVETSDQDSHESLWDRYEFRLRTSTHEALDAKTKQVVREADHLLLGFDPWTDYPILIHKPIIDQSHVYIGGGTGSGKTTRPVISLFSTLIRPRTDRLARVAPMPPMVIIDLKGDDVLLEKVIYEATRRAHHDNRELKDVFRFFTTQSGLFTNRFNPFPTFRGGDPSPIQLAQVFLEALNVNYGAGYGTGYFSAHNRSTLRKVLEHHNPHSFREINEILSSRALQGTLDPRQVFEAFELVEAIKALSYYDQMVTQPGDEETAPDVVHMDSVLERGQVVYFHLASAFESTTCQMIANLAVFALYKALVTRSVQRLPIIKTYLFVDEFQRLAGPNFPVILQQARSAGMTAILSNQSIADLDTPKLNLKRPIIDNSDLCIHMAMKDYETMKETTVSSGEEMYDVTSHSESFQETQHGVFRSWTATTSKAKKPRLTFDDLRAYSSDPDMMICEIGKNSGYSQFKGKVIPVRTLPALPFKPPEERGRSPYPTSDQIGVPETAVAKVSPEEVEAKIKANFTEARDQLDERLKNLKEELPDIYA